MTSEMKEIRCTFTSEASLYLAYMPFVKGGGIFVRTIQNYSLTEKVKLCIKLMDETEPYVIEGKIIWITPKGAQGNKPAGIGVQFCGEQKRYLCNKIETYLAGMLKSTQITDTI
ncbi:pilus assembly protein PilZ [Legionella israelensis]|uniref:Pilus assembly protein PilZ n=1 Tax=Legionella israelensis TaxID=454 RepID=A0AAX1EGE3_9GAMM|nr:PilZ domain-containing protein [Legionella israelensis]QBR84171.1 pilus assembly protein PilZ [Legionella israelensis]QDP72725.1 pilus assembly protein PilZ [Legionella israelensis]